MQIKTIAATVGGAALIVAGIGVALEPALAGASAKGASGDSPTNVVQVPGINGQLAGGPTIPTMTTGVTVTASPAATQGPSVIGNMGVVPGTEPTGSAATGVASFAPTAKATAAPQCIPDVNNPSCSIGLP